MSRRRAIIVMLACAASANTAIAAQETATSSPAATAAAQQPDAIRNGDQWTYELTDQVTGNLVATITYTVTEANAKEITTRVMKRGEPRPGMAVFDVHWNLKDDGLWLKKPGDGTGIVLPLQVGKEWKTSSNSQNLKTGEILKDSAKAKVTALETLTVQAGTYETFKIVTEVREVSPEDPTKSSLTTVETWYAPAVNRWVKRTFLTKYGGRVRTNVSFELVDYSRIPE